MVIASALPFTSKPTPCTVTASSTSVVFVNDHTPQESLPWLVRYLRQAQTLPPQITINKEIGKFTETSPRGTYKPSAITPEQNQISAI